MSLTAPKVSSVVAARRRVRQNRQTTSVLVVFYPKRGALVVIYVLKLFQLLFFAHVRVASFQCLVLNSAVVRVLGLEMME